MCEDESLYKFFRLAAFVREFADDLNNDVIVGGLCIDIGDTDFSVLEIELFDTLLDSLGCVSSEECLPNSGVQVGQRQGATNIQVRTKQDNDGGGDNGKAGHGNHE